jgi:Archaeal holliday junction resolvase (hjc).
MPVSIKSSKMARIVEAAILILIPLAIFSIILITLLYLDSLVLKELESLDYSSYENISLEHRALMENIKAVIINMSPSFRLASILAAINAGILTGVVLLHWLARKRYEKEIKENDKKFSMNKNYIKGRNKEYRIKRRLEKEGYYVIRSAGSHSYFDLVAINKEKERSY